MFVALVRVEVFVHLIDDFLVGAALEGDQLALVVEPEVEEERNLDASAAGVEDGGDHGGCVECWCLART